MLERAKIFGVISVLALSLAACAGNSDTAKDSTTSPDNTSETAAKTAVSPVVNKTSTPANGKSVAIPGVKNISQVKFKAPPTNKPLGAGVFDVVNNSNKQNHKVSKSQAVTVGGWAIIPNKNKPANNVIITLGDNKTVVAVASVNALRDDVAKTLKNPALKNSGWNTQIAPSTLPTGKVVLKAYAYDSGTKEAIQLNGNHNLEVTP